ncbi:MAG TPA: hypothetical protein VGH42_03680 [Verrucomicrobiae bacterium]|jgi:hypothetical protein
MAALYLIGYILVVGLLIRFTTGWEHDKQSVILCILAVAFVGWFLLLGMLSNGTDKKFGISFSRSSLKNGLSLFGGYLFTILFIVALGAVFIFLAWLLTGK